MKNKKILSIVVAALLIVGCSLWYFGSRGQEQSSPTRQTDGPTAEQLEQQAKSAAEQKQQAIEKGSNSTEATDQSSTNSSVSLTAQQEANGTVTVFTKLTNLSSGNCELTVSNGAKTISLTANVFYQPEYSSCAGFSVPINSLGLGTWTITLKVISNGNTASSNITHEVH